MVTKGGLDAITRSLAMEYAKEGIRFNTVAPGLVNTPMHETDSNEFLKTLSPMGEILKSRISSTQSYISRELDMSPDKCCVSTLALTTAAGRSFETRNSIESIWISMSGPLCWDQPECFATELRTVYRASGRRQVRGLS